MKLNEFYPIFGVMGILVIIISLIYVGNLLPGTTNWATVNDWLIGALPFMVIVFVGVYVVVFTSSIFCIAGSGVTGVGFALLVDYLSGQGVVDVTRWIRFGGTLNTLVAAIVIGCLLIGAVLSVVKK